MIDSDRLIADLDQSGFIRSGRFVVQFEDYPHFAEFWRCLVSAVGSGRNPIVDGLSILTYKRTPEGGQPNINDLMASYRRAFEEAARWRKDHLDKGTSERSLGDGLWIALRNPVDIAMTLSLDLYLIERTGREGNLHHALPVNEIYGEVQRGLAALQIWETVSDDPEVARKSCHDVYTYLREALAGWATYLGLGPDPWTLGRTDPLFFRDRLGSIPVGLPPEPKKP